MKFRKIPVDVDAIQFTGHNYRECQKYIGDNFDNTLNYPNIITSEGVMRVNPGDWIVQEPFDKERGFYPVKEDIFRLTYRRIKNNDKGE